MVFVLIPLKILYETINCQRGNWLEQWLMRSVLLDVPQSVCSPHLRSQWLDFHQKAVPRHASSSSSTNGPWPPASRWPCQARWWGQEPLQVVSPADYANVSNFEWSDVTIRCLVEIFLWENPVWSLAMPKHCWSIVRCHHWTRTFSGRFLDQKLTETLNGLTLAFKGL